MHDSSWLDEAALHTTLAGGKSEPDKHEIADLVDKSMTLGGLSCAEAATLCRVRSGEGLDLLFSAAKKVKEEIYGRRIVLFAPLYISNLCKNECLYCAFRASNKLLKRRALSMDEIRSQTVSILDEGHKRVLMVAGESYPKEDGFSYVLTGIEAIYSARNAKGDGIRRVNANVAPLSVDEFKELKKAGIGTYQLFQETYHRETYRAVHRSGKKADYDWRVNGMDRAMQAGIDDVGLGALFGLYDWRFELLATLTHARHLEERFGVGCHTISVPRIEPAVGSDMASAPPHAVSDEDFLKLVAILRLAVPYTGIIMSTRESAAMRGRTLELGVSQISAGSRTDPGGYSEARDESAAQFQLGDHRSLAEVIRDISAKGFIPSFCTACYRTGRTGLDFMELAKPGDIKSKCWPNALSTYLEYLMHYGQGDAHVPGSEGRESIERELARMSDKEAATARALLDKVASGKRDVFC